LLSPVKIIKIKIKDDEKSNYKKKEAESISQKEEN
jgi:hypothetical protein